MPSIKAFLNSFAEAEAVTQELLQAANAATPAGVIPRAVQERDANGKVYKVNVNLPVDIAKADLLNATSAINDNRGVASAAPSGIQVVNENFDAVVQDALQTSYTLDGFTLIASGASQNAPSITSQWQGSHAGEGVASKGLRLTRTDSTNTAAQQNCNFSQKLIFDAATNGLPPISGFTVQFDGKVSPTLNGGATDDPDHVRLYRWEISWGDFEGGGSMAFISSSSSNFQDTDWRLWMRDLTGASSAVIVQTDVPYDSFGSCKMEMDLSGKMKMTVGSFFAEMDLGGVQVLNSLILRGEAAHSYTTSGVKVSPPLILDNLSMYVESM